MKSFAILTVLLMITVSATAGAADMKSPTANVLSRLVWVGRWRQHGTRKRYARKLRRGRIFGYRTSCLCRLWRQPVSTISSTMEPSSVGGRGQGRKPRCDRIEVGAIVYRFGGTAPVLYGVPQGAVHGQIGYSLGFPGIYESDHQLKTDHILEVGGRPIPIAALVVANLSSASKVHYSASYINAGFSGGAIVYYVTNQEMWTIAGVITEFPIVPRPIYDGNGKDGTLHHAAYRTGWLCADVGGI